MMEFKNKNEHKYPLEILIKSKSELKNRKKIS